MSIVPFPVRPARPRLHPVASEGVEAIGYDAARRVLDIRYAGGALYRYFDVSPQRHRALEAAPSIGTYVNREIKPRYRYERIEAGRRRPAR